MISTMDRRMNLKPISAFVSYPNDVISYIDSLKQIVYRLNQTGNVAERLGFSLRVLDWMDGTSLGAEKPQDTIFKRFPIELWDIYIGPIWKRFGIPTGRTDPDTGKEYKSGFEEEFKTAYRSYKKTGRPRIFVYRCLRAQPLDKIDHCQLKLVDDFFEQLKTGGKYPTVFNTFKSMIEFERLVQSDLNRYLFEISEIPILTNKESNAPEREVPSLVLR